MVSWTPGTGIAAYGTEGKFESICLGHAKQMRSSMRTNMMRTNEALWTRIKNQVQSENIAGTNAGQWSARKAQLAVRRYKEAGGRYKGPKSSSNSLVRWSRQQWRTASGRPSHLTGERYLPSKAFGSLSRSELRTVNRLKREASARGQQFSRMPRSISAKVRRYRK